MRRGLDVRTHVRAFIAAGIGLALMATAPSAVAAEDCANADARPGSATAADMSAATLCLVNNERAVAGMRPLAASAPLARTAESYAGDMVATQHFAHTDTAGRTVAGRVSATGTSLDSWIELGENLGWGSLDQATPRAIVAGWMKSPTHRANVLHAPFDSLGVGVADGAPQPGVSAALTYTAVFGDQQQPRQQPRLSSAARRRCAKAGTRARQRACRARALRAAKLAAARQS